MIRRVIFTALAAAVCGAAAAVTSPHSVSATGVTAIGFSPFVPPPTPPSATSPGSFAPPGSLAAGQVVTVTLTALNGSSAVPGEPIDISLIHQDRVSGGGTAVVGTTQLTSTPATFTTDSSGHINITYTAPNPVATTGRDIINAADGTVHNSTSYDSSTASSYTYTNVASCQTNTCTIAASGSLGSGGSKSVVLTARDSGGAALAGADVLISLTSTAGIGMGSATATSATSGTSALTTSPTKFRTDGSGQITITYTAPSGGTSGGTDNIKAQNYLSGPNFEMHAVYTYGAQHATGWNGAASLGDGPLGNDPQSVSPGVGTIDVFWRAADNSLRLASYSGSPVGSWQAAVNLGGAGSSALTSNPSPVVTGGGTVDVFWKGADGNLWHDYKLGGGSTWSGPASLGGGPLGSDPTTASSGHGDVAVFWKGMDNNLWQARYLPGFTSWDIPRFLGSGPLGGTPHGAAYTTNSYDVFWTGMDGSIWHTYGADAFSGPQSIGMGPIGGPPIPVEAGQFAINLYWQGADGGLWHAWYAAGWKGPQGYGGSVASQPSPIVVAGQVDVFWRGGQDFTNGDVWHLPGGVPTALFEPNLASGTAPSAFSWGGGHEEVFWRGQDGNLWHDWTG